MKVYLGTDHAGFNLKESVKKILLQQGHAVEDCGAVVFDKNDDYPDFVAKAAQSVADDPGSMGIVFGKSGAGECMVANKIKGIRAFLAVDEKNVKLAREHNDVNVMSLGSEIVDQSKIQELLKLFLETAFSGEERHKRRIGKIAKLES